MRVISPATGETTVIQGMSSADPMAPMPPMISGMYPVFHSAVRSCIGSVLITNRGRPSRTLSPSFSMPCIDGLQSNLYGGPRQILESVDERPE